MSATTVDYSVFSLVCSLCQTTRTTYERRIRCRGEKRAESASLVRRLKRIAFENVLKRRQKRRGMSSYDELAGKLYEMRITRNFDAANQIEENLLQFHSSDSFTEKESILRFLLCLTNIDANQKPRKLYEFPTHKPSVCVLPSNALFFSDSSLSSVEPNPGGRPYLHYSSDLFEAEIPSRETDGFNELFQRDPGSGLAHIPRLHVKSKQRDLDDDNDEGIDLTSSEEIFNFRSNTTSRYCESYFTEAKCGDFDAAYRLHQSNVAALSKEAPPSLEILHENDLVDASYQVILGISSRVFLFDENCLDFAVASDVTKTGCSPVSTRALLEEFCVVGRDYIRLDRLAAKRGGSCPENSGGLISHAFGLALEKYLYQYRTCVVAIEKKDLSLLGLLDCVRNLGDQLGFLGDLCGTRQNPRSPVMPKGIELLSYLYDTTAKCASSPHYTLLLFFLEKSLHPYLWFLHGWIFYGILSDPCGELMIRMNEQYLSFRGVYFWTHGYTIATSENSIPTFLSKWKREILVCGKSVNLLRVCCPKNVLLERNLSPPPLKLCWTMDSLHELEEKCQLYRSDVESKIENADRIKRQLEFDRKKETFDEAVAKRHKAIKAIQRDEDLRMQQREKEDEKKRQLLESLKKQLEESIERKESVAKQEREEDLKRMQVLADKEALEAQLDQDLKERVKEELVAHYAELSREAAKREERASWRIKRAELDEERRKFLREDDSHWIEAPAKNADDEESKPLEILPEPESDEKSSLVAVEAAMRHIEGVGDTEEENGDVGNVDSLAETTAKEEEEKGEEEAEKGDDLTAVYKEEVVEETATDDERAEKILVDDKEADGVRSSRGQAPPSVVQDLLYLREEDSDFPAYHSTRGAAPPSTIQNLMYPLKFRENDVRDETAPQGEEFNAWADPVLAMFRAGIERYKDDFGCLGDRPDGDLIGKVVDASSQDDELLSLDAGSVLPDLIARSILAPLESQVELVNSVILKYFMQDLKIGEHFEAIRLFLLLEDGEFGHALTDSLFHKIASGVSVIELCSYPFLNGLLAQSLQASLHRDSDCTFNLGFALKHIPAVLNPFDVGSLDFLQLRYEIKWPLNIVITESSIAKYNKLFCFMLQLKRASWVLKEIGIRLKRSGLQMQRKGEQYHKLHLFRHEMQHFVNVMSGYVVNQILNVSWKEFQEKLSKLTGGLDELQSCHNSYLNTMLYRSLLTKRASSVMNIIRDVLSCVLRFRVQLMSDHWRIHFAQHPAFDNMVETHKKFQEYSFFLFSVVSRLVERGYQPHLEDLLLRLNFNGFCGKRPT